MKSKITIGGYAGGKFTGQSQRTGAYHAVRVFEDGSKQFGFMLKRKWLFDRAAFNYCPTLGWAYEHWFEWNAVQNV